MKKMLIILLFLLYMGLLAFAAVGCEKDISPGEDVYKDEAM